MEQSRSWWSRLRSALARETHEPDLHDRALPELRAKAASNPRLAALLDEVERGRQRRADDPPVARSADGCSCKRGDPSITGHIALDLGDGYRVYEIGVNGYLALHGCTGLGTVVGSPAEAVAQIDRHRTR